MRNLFLTSAAALAMAFGATAVSGQGMTSPTNAPNATNANNPSVPTNREMTSQQKSSYETWPADKKAAYDTWAAEYQAYFWSLSPSQQTGWFALTDEQRKQVYEMPPASRAAAWASIEQQLAGTADSAAPPSAATGMMPAPEAGAAPMDSDAAAMPDAAAPMASQPGAMGSSSAGATADPAVSAPPAEAMNKTYPKCSRTVQDSCRNPGGV
jgi:hypothetical protein